ncbi:MAG: glycosyltransferase [Elusimicrobia bacterium]|nr:glycosyltransferase [Elusimicrobiota bacterium]
MPPFPRPTAMSSRFPPGVSDVLASEARLGDYGESGPCEARNRAVLAASTPWIFLIDADAEPAPDCLERLLEAAEAHPSAAVISPRVLLAKDPGRIQYDGGSCHFLGEMCFDNARRPLSSAVAPSLRPVVAATTALLIHRERALGAGLFDPELVFFREDLEFCLRLGALGFPVVHCPEAVVYHRPAPKEARGPLHRRRVFFQTRNRWWTILKLFEWRTVALTLPAQLAYEALNLAFALREREAAQYAASWLSLVANLPGLLRSRRAVQRRRKAADRHLLGAPELTWRMEALRAPLAPMVQRATNALCRGWWRAVAPLLSR